MYKEHDKGPLHIACITNDVQLLKIVSELGCDPNLVNTDGDTPLHLACKFELTRTLLEMKCDTKIRNEVSKDP